MHNLLAGETAAATPAARPGHVPTSKRLPALGFVQGLLYRLAFAHVGKLSMVADYYIFTQWLHGQHVVVSLWGQPSLDVQLSLAAKLYADGYDAVVIGIIAGFAAKRISRPVLNANMLYFCRRWVARGRRAHWWMPPGMRATIQGLLLHLARDPNAADLNREKLAAHGRLYGPFITAATIVLLILAVYGFYILAVIA